MGKDYSAYSYVSSTGTGIAIGTNIDLAGVVRHSGLAGTVTIKAGSVTILGMSASDVVTLDTPIGIAGPVTMTSSAGVGFTVIFHQRAQ